MNETRPCQLLLSLALPVLMVASTVAGDEMPAAGEQAVTAEQIEAATGVDILGSMRGDQADSEPDSELPPPPPAPEA